MKAIVNLFDHTMGHRSVRVRTLRRRYNPVAGSAVSFAMLALAAVFGLWLTSRLADTHVLGPLSMDIAADPMTTGSISKPSKH